MCCECVHNLSFLSYDITTASESQVISAPTNCLTSASDSTVVIMEDISTDGWQTVSNKRQEKHIKIADKKARLAEEARIMKAREKEAARALAAQQAREAFVQNFNYQAKTEGLDIVESTQAHAQDAVFASARKCIIDFNRRRFATFTDPLIVEAVDSEATIFGGLQSSETTVAVCGSNTWFSDLESKKMAMVICASEAKGKHIGGDLMRTSSLSRKPRELNTSKTLYQKAVAINLRLARDSPMGRFNTVEANIDGKWQAFCDWHGSLEQSIGPSLFGFEGWKAQQWWWSKIRQIFRLMDLPAELRALILEQAIGRTLKPVCESRKIISYGNASNDYPEDERHFERPATSVLFMCRQLYEDLKHYLWTGSRKSFISVNMLQLYINRAEYVAPAGINHLRHIELSLSHTDFMQLFEVMVAPFNIDGAGLRLRDESL